MTSPSGHRGETVKSQTKHSGVQDRDEVGMRQTEVSVPLAYSGPVTSLSVSHGDQHTPTKETGFGYSV